MNAKGIVGVIVGIVLIIVGYMGSSVFSMLPDLPLAWQNTVTDYFTDGTPSPLWSPFTWNDGAIVESGGKVIVTTPMWTAVAGYVSQNAYDLSSFEVTVDFTLEERQAFSLEVSSDGFLNQPPNQNPYLVRIYASVNSYRIVFESRKNGELDQQNIIEGWTATEGSLRLVGSGGTITGYYNSGSGWVSALLVSCPFTTSGDSYIFLSGHAGTIGGVVTFDNFMLNYGQDEPPPPPDTGTLVVRTYLDSQEISGVSLSIGYPTTSKSGVSPYTDTNAPAGNYYATGTYNGESDTASGYLAADGTLTLQLSWGTTPPPEPDDGDWIEIFDNTVVRYLLMGSGALTCIIGFASMFSGGVTYRREPY